ncbi:DNA ligase 4 isoform X3 [Ceratina calcarata]|uniref:DNA ligase 4 n=1 Tax=Ceratina calcarata TaxID=156304 RepID=A0AAJ7WG33_9HYME|nr:DNA ligase 4 isoform X3 [Ceratina calcarata]
MSETIASNVKFEELCTVLEEVSKASGEKKKTDTLEKFISKCRNKLKSLPPETDVSLFPILRLILPRLERERGAYDLKHKSLAALYTRVFCLGTNQANSLKQYKTSVSSKITGCDFAERALSILKNRLPRKSSDFTIERINLFLDDISSKTDIGSKEEKFKILLRKTNGLEFKWITRIILKDLRLGIGDKKIFAVYHPDANSMFEVSSDLHQVCDTLQDPFSRHQQGIKIFSHFKPMLLERYQIEDADKLFANGEQYIVQCKYDGERSQIHMKDGKYKYLTRQGYDITNNPGYGESNSSGFMSSVLGRLLNSQVKSIILDGELIGWHKTRKELGSKGMNYDVKKLTEKSHHQPCFVAYDIILYNDELLNNEPYEKRLEILKDAFKEEEGCLLLAESNKISNSEQLCKRFNRSMKDKEEGIVLKKCDSKYRPNVRVGTGCYKIKAEYSDGLVQDVDLIILGGYYGEGSFIGLIKSFLMGVASPPTAPGENPAKFFSVVSVSNGLPRNTLEELGKMFEDKWQAECPENVLPPRRDPPTLWIRPENSIIFTIRATEITSSNDYPTGYSLRFPRVTCVRTDKPWHSVCTTDELSSLIKDARPIQKLTKREANCEDIEEPSEVKRPKAAKRRPIKVEEKMSNFTIYDNPPTYITRLLENKEICVVNGDDEFSKEQIEIILSQHKAKVVQSPLKETYCIIVGDVRKPRANHFIRSKEYDVVTVDWFRRVTKEENWSSLGDFLPWELLSSRESTKNRLAQYYDDYYDHYTIDADEETLLRSFKRIEELFDTGVSPHSMFRGIVGYFKDQSDLTKYEFQFMAGTIKESIDDSVTHVFINNDNVSPELQDFIDGISPTLTISKSDWIGECFKQNAVIPYSKYLLR